MKAAKFTGDFRFDLLVLTTLLATGTHPLHAQGLIAFTNHGGEVAAPFTDDEGALLGYAYAAQLQTAEGTSIGPRSYFNSIGRFSGGIRAIPGIPPGESADLKIAVFGPGGQVGTSNTFSVVLGGDGKRPPGLTGLEPTTVKRYKVYDLVECAPRSEDSPTAAEARAHVTHFGEERLLVPASQLDGNYAFGDLDGDQDLDILATSLTNGYRVFLQDQNGRYQSHLGPNQSNELNQVTLGDLDGDGDLDGWFSANGTESELWLNDGSGTFTQSNANIGNNADRVALSDLDSDGDLDAIVHAAAGTSSQIQSWLNDGKGHFTMEARFDAPCDSAARQFQVGDLNGDSLPDYVYVCGTSLFWRPNLGAGQFTDPVGGLNATSILSPIQIDEHPISIVDIDRDGDNDVVVPYQNLPSSLWLNNGNGEFGLSTAMIGSRDRRLSPPFDDGSGRFELPPRTLGSVTVGDLDGDGDPDILETEEHGTRIYWNEGHCDFRPWLSLPATVPHLIDIDRDDDLDLIVRRDSGLVAILNQPVKLSSSDGANPVELPDGQLRRVIATTLDKSEDAPIYLEELEQLKRLDCSHRAWGPFSLPIEDFSGLEFATGLKVLDLSGSWNPGFRVTGLSTLKRWPELDILKLDNNFLHGFALTKELTSLKELHLTNNRLTELLLPNGIDSLQALYLAENDIRELTLPPTLTDLRFLDVNGNRLRNLELSSLHTKVEQILANDNQIEALALPLTLTTLTRLDLAGNKLQSIAVPQEWTQLRHLDLQRNPLSEVVTPTEYFSLRSLALSGSLETSGLSFLANLPALEDLTLTESSLELSGINPLPHLKHLKVTESRLASLSLPVGYQNLETLKISGDMTSLELPSDLSQLREIEIRETKLTQLNLPPGLHSLEEFTATKNQIRRIEVSSDARQLRTLNLTWNNTLEGLRLPEGVGADAQGPHEIQFFGSQTERLELPTYWPHPRLYTSALINASSFKVNPDGQVELEILGSYGLIQLERSVDLKSWTPVETVENQGEPYSFRILDTSAPDSPQVFYRVQHLRF